MRRLCRSFVEIEYSVSAVRRKRTCRVRSIYACYFHRCALVESVCVWSFERVGWSSSNVNSLHPHSDGIAPGIHVTSIFGCSDAALSTTSVRVSLMKNLSWIFQALSATISPTPTPHTSLVLPFNCQNKCKVGTLISFIKEITISDVLKRGHNDRNRSFVTCKIFV